MVARRFAATPVIADTVAIRVGDFVSFVWSRGPIEVGAENLDAVEAMRGEIVRSVPGGCPPSRWVDVLARQA